MSEMATYGWVPQKIEVKPKRYHGYAVLLFIMGTLLPPLAVAARFGIGRDFWLNVVLTICGYIPGHGHNFYIQNIRNNKNHARTPKWVQKYGLVDLSEIRRKERKSQWANRYKDRLPQSTLEGQPYEDGQTSSVDIRSLNNDTNQRTANGELWRPEDESYYNKNAEENSGGRWHYPANFDDAVLDRALLKQKKKKKTHDDKKNRWERTQDAYSIAEEESSGRKRKSKKKRKSSSVPDSIDSQSINSGSTEYPEDPVGGLYGNSSRVAPNPQDQFDNDRSKTKDEVFSHQF